MGVLTHIVAADEDEVEAVGESLQPADEWSGMEVRGIDTEKVATLHSLLTGDAFDDAVVHYEPIYVSMSEGALVLRLADEAAERLAGLEAEAIEQVAAELAATEAFESEDWAEEDIMAMLAELADLTRLADAQGQVLFVWMHPLRT